MVKIDIISGFLGAGKTTLIKKLLKDGFQGEQVVLIENEFGEIGIDGGFLKEAGIQIREMNSGCICCSLVGDFGTSLKEVVTKYNPDRILIEPSGVGKLSDVIKAVQGVQDEVDIKLNSYTTVVDAKKCKMYMKNFGEFFDNQIQYAGAIIMSRTDIATEKKVQESLELLRSLNKDAAIITTPIENLDGKKLVEVMEHPVSLEQEMLEEEHEHHHHHHDDECGCGHDHDHEEHEHHHDHDHDEECGCGHDHDHHHHHHPGGVDPHTWSSISGAKVIAKNTLDAFVSLDPENKEYYQANYEQLTKEIGETEKTVSGLLHSLDNKTFIIYHPALTYLANEYGLTQLCIEMDGKEPSPAQLKELVETAREHNAKVVFIQREFDQKNAELIAKETGCRLIPINPLDYDWGKEMIHIAKSLADGQAD